ncbi:MAG: hypothetical protein SF053_08505 [Bacteroidia bacterium]|nr:hypothetical protein [Bacteroidia bacterium]
MKITVTPSHIRSARLTEGKRTPVELAVMDLECFEDVALRPLKTVGYYLELDGEKVKLPRKVQGLIQTWQETGEMEPFAFDLKPGKDVSMSPADGLFLYNPYDEGYSYGWVA